MSDGDATVKEHIHIIPENHNIEKNKTNAPDSNSKDFIIAFIEKSYHSFCT